MLNGVFPSAFSGEPCPMKTTGMAEIDGEVPAVFISHFKSDPYLNGHSYLTIRI
jgi:hypothetical protein